LLVASVYDGGNNPMPTLADFELQLPAGRSPSLQLYSSTGPVGVPIVGVASVNPSIYIFPFSSVGVGGGTYSYRITNPEGAGRIRVTATTVERLDGCNLSGSTGTVIVAPTVGQLTRDLVAQSIEAPTDSDFVLARLVVDGSGANVALPSGLYFALSDSDEQPITILTPTIAGSTYTVTIPRAVTRVQRVVNFALRSIADSNQVYDWGTIQFIFAATES
jgi:hypothetical protein